MSEISTTTPVLAMDERLTRNPELISRKLGDELVILDADGTKLITLNETAAAIWEMLDGQKSIQRVVERLVASYSVDEATAREDVVETARRFLSEGLVSRGGGGA